MIRNVWKAATYGGTVFDIYGNHVPYIVFRRSVVRTQPKVCGISTGNQWWQLDGRYCALGIHGQMIAVDPKAALVVVFVSSPPEPNSTQQRQQQLRIVAALAAELS